MLLLTLDRTSLRRKPTSVPYNKINVTDYWEVRDVALSPTSNTGGGSWPLTPPPVWQRIMSIVRSCRERVTCGNSDIICLFLIFYCVYSYLVCYQLICWIKFTNTSHRYRQCSKERPVIRNEEDIRLGGSVNTLGASFATGWVQIKLHEWLR